MLVRMAYRLRNPPTPLRPELLDWQRHLSALDHGAL